MFCTFGTVEFEGALQRIAEETKNLFPRQMILRPKDVDAEFAEATRSVLFRPGSRGAGFYVWKPWAVKKALDSLGDGELLLYADAGCRVAPDLKDFQHWITELQGPKSVLLHQMTPNPELRWTNDAAFEALMERFEDMETPQRAATYLLLRKTPESQAFIQAWYDVAVTRPDLFSDAYDANTKDVRPSSFIDHRWDQSILSLLSKKAKFAPCIALREFSSNEAPVWHARQR